MKTIANVAATALRKLRMRPSTSQVPEVDQVSDPPTRSSATSASVEELTRRVEHLEAALEGLQDAVYRQDVLHDRQIADLRKERPTGPVARWSERRGKSS